MCWVDTAEEFSVTAVCDKMQDYRRNWIRHLNRLPRDRGPRITRTANGQAEGTGEDHWGRCVRSEQMNKWPNCTAL